MKNKKEGGVIIKIGVIIEKGGKLLLIKEKSRRDGIYYWNIIKGSFDLKKDKELMSAAKRESTEEANANIKIKGIANILYLRKKGRLLIQFNFWASLIGSNFHISPKMEQRKYGEGEDIIDAKMFSRKELTAMRRKDFMGVRAYTAIDAWLKGRWVRKDLIKVLESY